MITRGLPINLSNTKGRAHSTGRVSNMLEKKDKVDV